MYCGDLCSFLAGMSDVNNMTALILHISYQQQRQNQMVKTTIPIYIKNKNRDLGRYLSVTKTRKFYTKHGR